MSKLACRALCLGLALGGCSVAHFESGTSYRDSEGRFSPQLFAELTPGQTTDVWLQQQFGPPVWVDQAPFEVAIYTWQFQREVHKRRQLLWVLSQRSVKQEKEFLHAVMQRGKLVKHWQDGTANVDVERVTYALGLDRPLPPVARASDAPPASQQMPGKGQALRIDADTSARGEADGAGESGAEAALTPAAAGDLDAPAAAEASSG